MNVIHDREQGKIPISIGTSLAIEGLLGTHDEYSGGEKNRPILTCECLSINVRTLIRNMLGSIDKQSRYMQHIDSYVGTIFDEMQIIRSAVEMASVKPVKFHFYISQYKNLERFFKYCKFKQLTTANQLQAAEVEERICKAIIAKVAEHNATTALSTVNVEVFDLYPTLPDKKVYIVTHLPIDLLLCQGHRDLLLLESHTGAVKSKANWFTKLKNGKRFFMIPFDKAMVQLFGDSGDVIAPIDHRYKDVTVKIAERFNWNSLTTKDRILATIQMANEPFLLDAVKKMYG